MRGLRRLVSQLGGYASRSALAAESGMLSGLARTEGNLLLNQSLHTAQSSSAPASVVSFCTRVANNDSGIALASSHAPNPLRANAGYVL